MSFILEHDGTCNGDLVVKGTIKLEETGGGTDLITLQSPAVIASSYSITLPTSAGSDGFFLKTDGSGVTEWADVVHPPDLFTSSIGDTFSVKTHTATATNAYKSIWVTELGKYFMVTSTVNLIQSSPAFSTTSDFTDINPFSNSVAVNALAWSPDLDLLIAVGASGNIASSPDGTTWTQRSMPSGMSTRNVYDVVWNSGLSKFVACTTQESDTIISSTDGTTWVAIGGSQANINSDTIGYFDTLIYSPDLGKMIGYRSSNSNSTRFCAYSTNGQSWTLCNTHASISGLIHTTLGKYKGAWSPTEDVFCIVSKVGSRSMTSADGATWTITTTTLPGSVYGSTLWAPEYSSFFVCDIFGEMYYSADGTSWTHAASYLDAGTAVGGMAYNDTDNQLITIFSGGRYGLFVKEYYTENTLTNTQIKTQNLVIDSVDSRGTLTFVDSGTGSNRIIIKAGDLTTAVTTHTLVLPPALGSSGSVLTDISGNGVLTWETPSGSASSAVVNSVQYTDDGSTFTGSADFTYDGTSLKLADSKDITIGTDDDLVMTHDGSDGSISSSTGALTLETTGTTSGDNLLIRCGTNTGNTKISFYAGATEVISFSDKIYVFDDLLVYDNKGLYFGNGGADGGIVSNGSSVTWTHVTGDLTFDNTNATGATVLRLGDDSAATAVQIKNNSDAVVMSFDSKGKLGLTDTGAGTNQVTLKAGDGTTAVTAHTLVLPPVLGSSGSVLTDTAGDGVLTWEAPSGGESVGGTNALQVASGTDFTGTQDLTYDGTSLKLTDSKDITIGTDDDLVMTHDGSDGSISSATGALTLETTGTTSGDNLLIRCGTNTGNTKISFYAGATEVISFSDNIYVFDDLLVYDNKGLYFGNGGADGGIVSNGSSVTWTHVTGDLTFDNTNATGATVLRLGDDSAATAVQIKNNSDAVVMSFDSEGKLGLTDTGAGTNQITLKAGDGSTAVTAHTLVLPPAQGSDGQVLTNNGSGILAWETPSVGGAVEGAIQYRSSTGTLESEDTFKYISASNNLQVSSDNSGTVSGLSAPTVGNQAATKSYVDDLVAQGISWKNPVLFASTLVDGHFTVAGEDETKTIDGTALSTLSVGDRVLLKNQTTNTGNGIYEVTSVSGSVGAEIVFGFPSDTVDAKASGTAVFVESGTVNADQGFVVTDVTGTDELDAATTISFGKFTHTNIATPAAVIDSVQFTDDGATFTGSTDFTYDGTNLKLVDSKKVVLGTSNDLTITHDGTSNIVDCGTDVPLIFRLGADTGSNSFQVRNNSDKTLATVNPAGGLSLADVGVGTNQITVRAGDGSTAVTAHTLTLPPAQGSDGSVLTNNGSGVLSWGTISSGTVTQTTSASTAVTLNTRSGVITTVSLTIAAGGYAAFLVNNTICSSTDVIMINVVNYTGNGYVTANIYTISNGSFGIRLMNASGFALNTTAKIAFYIVPT